MSKYKVDFTLKQHTPIIHFQSDQYGATLRATELKPKFDKFLKEYIFKNNLQEYKQFLIKDKEAFDYKVNISQDISKEFDIDKKSLYFGNMGEGKDKKYKQNPQKVKIDFFSYNLKLLDLINNNFETFIAMTNFGTRQSKGYGSFYLTDKSFDKSLIPYTVYNFSSKNWENDLKVLYSFLRQGINYPNREGTRFYSKPAIFSYAKSKGWDWDKKAIKDKFNNQNDPNDVSYILRDLFGLSSEQSWGRDTISKENSHIERFKSPITFKIIEDKVYFWVNNSYQKILNKEFTIQKNKQGKLNLKTPKEFNFNEFLDFAFNINLSQHIESQYHTESEYAQLNKIFKDIKANL